MSDTSAVREELRFPIGRVYPDPELSSERRGELIGQIEAAPAALRDAVDGLTAAQLDTAYRPGGWTVRQVVHHVPDSHMNGYIRFKHALTRDEPEVQSYDQTKWAETAEARTAPPEVSLALLDALHERWVALLRSLTAADFARVSRHPKWGPITLDVQLQIYAWHGRHHTAHITSLRQREGW